jgi:hypothetical protein
VRKYDIAESKFHMIEQGDSEESVAGTLSKFVTRFLDSRGGVVVCKDSVAVLLISRYSTHLQHLRTSHPI